MEYRSPKTAKLFFQGIQKHFERRDQTKIISEFKDFYNFENYSNVPQKSWQSVQINVRAYVDANPSLGGNFSKMMDNIQIFAIKRASKNYFQCFQQHMNTLVSLLRLLDDMKDESSKWLIKPLVTIVRASKKLYLTCESQVKTNSQAQKAKNILFQTIQRFKTTKTLQDRIKKQFLSLVDVMQVSILLSFHNYEQANRIIMSQKVYGEVARHYQNIFLFQKGKYMLVNQNFKQAQKCFTSIQISNQHQKRLVMKYLIPCKMLLDYQFVPKNQQQYQKYHQYMAITHAIKTVNFQALQEASKKYQKVWLKRGIYLLMDRARLLLWRSLLARLKLIYGHQIQFENIRRAVQLRGGKQDINQCICIVGNLIYEGYIKGYIFQNQTKRVLALKKQKAFPRCNTFLL